MSARSSRRRNRPRGAPSSPPASPVRPMSAPAVGGVPSDLCHPSLIQQGFSSFAARPAGIGAPLISVSESATASAKTLAAESLVHTAEGWRYMASAMNAMLAHCPKQSIHFSYYAELRASVAILASHGMRVRWPNSAYVAASGAESSPYWKKEGTHSLVWRLWSAWAATTSAEDFFLDSLRVHPAVTLRHFKDAVSQVSAPANLTAWARDLELTHEHKARNEASYEALYSREAFTSMGQGDFEFVRDLWALAEPTAVGLQFECQLVHWMLEQSVASEEAHSLAASGKTGAGAQWLSRVLAEVERLTGVPTPELSSALSLGSAPSPIFAFAFDPALLPQNIAARAFFLLRLATLPIGSAFAAYPTSAGREWLREWLTHAGILNAGTSMDPADAWADFSHLPGIASPPPPLPAQLLNDPAFAQDALRMARSDAVLAWSVPL